MKQLKPVIVITLLLIALASVALPSYAAGTQNYHDTSCRGCGGGRFARTKVAYGRDGDLWACECFDCGAKWSYWYHVGP